MAGFEQQRRMMVDGQVRTSDVTDARLLDAMLAVPREEFVPADQVPLAYQDRDLVVAGAGATARCLLKPMVLAKLLHAADLRATDRVLDIGCATGYSTAIIARLAPDVTGLEEDEPLARAATANLRKLAPSATVQVGTLADGLPGKPFDVIVINGAIEQLPDSLTAQLAEGGRLVCILGTDAAAKAMLYVAFDGDVSGRPVFDAAAAALPGFSRPRAFVF